MKVLIVEDDFSIINLYTKILKESFQADVFTATHFDAAVDLFDNGIVDFDLVVCDHNFPYCPTERPEELGATILFELISVGFKKHFLHFSRDPVPDKYLGKDRVIFHSIDKSASDAVELFCNYVKSLKIN